MRFYQVLEDVCASEWAVVGYYNYRYDAWQEFQKSTDRAVVQFELDGKQYVATRRWDHEDNDDDNN